VRLHQVRVAGVGTLPSALVAVLVASGWVCSGVLALPGRPPAITSQLASPIRSPIGLHARHGVQAFPPLDWGRARGRALEPPSVDQGRDDAAGPEEVAPVESPPLAPQSKPVTLAPASWRGSRRWWPSDLG